MNTIQSTTGSGVYLKGITANADAIVSDLASTTPYKPYQFSRWITVSGNNPSSTTTQNTTVTMTKKTQIKAITKRLLQVNVYLDNGPYSTQKVEINGTASNTDSLEKYSSNSGSTWNQTFALPSNKSSVSKNRLHFTPVWYPDGSYTVAFNVYDVWTPSGELYVYATDSITIDGTMYDDYHSVREN